MIWDVVNSIVGGLAVLEITKVISSQKYKINIFNILILGIYVIVLTLNNLILDNFLKVIISFICNTMLVKVFYKETMEKSLIIAFVEYITILLSECIVGLICSLIMNFAPQVLNNNIDIIKHNVILNILVLLFAYMFTRKFQGKYVKLINKVSNNSSIILAILALIILICMSSLFYKIEMLNWTLNSAFLLDTVIIVIIGAVGILLIVQKLEYDKKNRQYQDLAKYSEINASLLEDYSVLNHEHKNQLIVIKGMLESKSDELEGYVDSLLESKDKIKYTWIRDLNNITFQGLKSFINYKILEMKSKKLKVYVTISKECKKYKIERLTSHEKDQIYSIIGVYLDNAMEAAEESKKKEIILTGYIQNKEMYIEIANTYAGEIDLEKINNYGYTSKGTGHGTGLYMIEKIVRNSNHFNTKTEIRNGFFIQTLIINFPEK